MAEKTPDKLDFYKLNFDIKAVGLLLLLAGMWYDLKTDFAVYKEKHSFLEYRISQIEKKPLASNIMMPSKSFGFGITKQQHYNHHHHGKQR